jgi:RNA polymerase sigma factor (TIGR02999 family)
LRKLAAEKLAHENPGQTLEATALVHEAYLRLVDTADEQSWDSRGHFFAAAAEAMRRILVENARRKKRVRHGGELQQVPLEGNEPAIVAAVDEVDLLALSEALDHLEAAYPRRAQLVKLRYFAGFTLPEVAQMLGISQSTAEADWTYSKAWLKREMEKS